jgi:hypothetical protein
MIYINIITEEKVDTDQREKCDTDRDSVVSEQSLEGGCISPSVVSEQSIEGWCISPSVVSEQSRRWVYIS